MKDGKKHGFGKYMGTDGSLYIGYWKNDEPNGFGRNIFVPEKEGLGAEGYEGFLVDGVANGFGKFIHEDG